MKIIRLFCLGLFCFGVFSFGIGPVRGGFNLANGEEAGNAPTLEKQFTEQFSEFYRFSERRGMIPVTFTDAAGNNGTIDDYKGKFVLYHFWATWCAPCLKELPVLAALQDHMKDRDDFVIVPVSLDYNPDIAKVAGFMKRSGADSLPVLIVPPGEGGWDQLTGFALPTSFIIGKDGAILYRLVGDGKWMSAITLEFLDNLLSGQTK